MFVGLVFCNFCVASDTWDFVDLNDYINPIPVKFVPKNLRHEVYIRSIMFLPATPRELAGQLCAYTQTASPSRLNKLFMYSVKRYMMLNPLRNLSEEELTELDVLNKLDEPNIPDVINFLNRHKNEMLCLRTEGDGEYYVNYMISVILESHSPEYFLDYFLLEELSLDDEALESNVFIDYNAISIDRRGFPMTLLDFLEVFKQNPFVHEGDKNWIDSFVGTITWVDVEDDFNWGTKTFAELPQKEKDQFFLNSPYRAKTPGELAEQICEGMQGQNHIDHGDKIALGIKTRMIDYLKYVNNIDDPTVKDIIEFMNFERNNFICNRETFLQKIVNFGDIADGYFEHVFDDFLFNMLPADKYSINVDVNVVTQMRDGIYRTLLDTIDDEIAWTTKQIQHPGNFENVTYKKIDYYNRINRVRAKLVKEYGAKTFEDLSDIEKATAIGRFSK